MAFAFGDIYFVEFDPSIGHEYKGRRPAMVIQEEEISKNSPVVTIMPLTSQLNQLRPHDVLVPKDFLNKLSSNSIIKVKHIHSFDRERFLFKMGRVGSPIMRQVRGYIRRHFGL